MATFLPPDQWVALHEWLAKVDTLLADWAKVKQEAEQCMASTS